jgi:hypothetical protein
MTEDSSRDLPAHADDAAPSNESRRRVLKAGLKAGAVAAPAMITIKSTTAFANSYDHDDYDYGYGGKGGKGSGDKGDKGSVYGSISCIQHVDMPDDKEDALRRICGHYGIKYTKGSSKGGYYNSSYDSDYDSYGRGGYQDDPDCDSFRDYFETVDFRPYCTYLDPSNEHHCTYMNLMLSTACLNSIQQSGHWKYPGKDYKDFKGWGNKKY